LHREVGFLDHDKTVSLIRDPIKNSAIYYDDSVVERIWKLSGGHPFFIQQLCWNCIDILNQCKKDYQVKDMHLEKAIDATLAYNEVLKKLWNEEMHRDDQVILKTLSNLSENEQSLVLYSELVRQSRLSEKIVSQSLQKLEIHQLIEEIDSKAFQQKQYRFGIDLLRLWVKQVTL
jgi:vacuolar-type H+-ATPase catalytic subunit A/Vma1